nr:uncharacterized protein LOC111421823 [Onthophagus taurus]
MVNSLKLIFSLAVQHYAIYDKSKLVYYPHSDLMIFFMSSLLKANIFANKQTHRSTIRVIDRYLRVKMYRRSKPLTEKELLAIWENSDSEEDFIGHLEDQSDDGWIDTDEEANEVHATDADAQDTQSESDAEDIVEEVDPAEPPTKVARGNFVWPYKFWLQSKRLT